jgi:hypothetical protein
MGREEPPSFAALPPQVIATDQSRPVCPLSALATISAGPVRGEIASSPSVSLE